MVRGGSGFPRGLGLFLRGGFGGWGFRGSTGRGGRGRGRLDFDGGWGRGCGHGPADPREDAKDQGDSDKGSDLEHKDGKAVEQVGIDEDAGKASDEEDRANGLVFLHRGVTVFSEHGYLCFECVHGLIKMYGRLLQAGREAFISRLGNRKVT